MFYCMFLLVIAPWAALRCCAGVRLFDKVLAHADRLWTALWGDQTWRWKTFYTPFLTSPTCASVECYCYLSCRTCGTHLVRSTELYRSAIDYCCGVAVRLTFEQLLFFKWAVEWLDFKPSTHRRRRRDSTVELSRVGGVNAPVSSAVAIEVTGKMASLLKKLSISIKLHAVKPLWSLFGHVSKFSTEYVGSRRSTASYILTGLTGQYIGGSGRSWVSCDFCSHCRRRRDAAATRQLSRVGVVSVYCVLCIM